MGAPDDHRTGDPRKEIAAFADGEGDKAVIRRLLREMERQRLRKADMVEAVYRAVADAFAAHDDRPVRAPKVRAGPGPEEAAIAVIGDWQLGKTTPDYDSDTTEQRVERYGDKIERIVAIQRADHPVNDLHIFAVGDIVEGELIFPGQSHRIDASLYRQVVRGVDIMEAFVRRMLALVPGSVEFGTKRGRRVVNIVPGE